MAFKIGDCVKDTAAAITGTGPYTLSNAPPSGFQSFQNGIGDGNRTVYRAVSPDGASWELMVGLYTQTSPAQGLSRDICLASTNSGNPINWGGVAPSIFSVDPAELANAILHPGWASGRFYGAPVQGSAGTGTPGLNRCYATPIVVPDFTATLTVGVETTVLASAGGLVRLGFSAVKNGAPSGAPLGDSGLIATDAGLGAKTFQFTGKVIPPGVYALLANFSIAAPTARTNGLNADNTLFALLGGSSVTDLSQRAPGWYSDVGSGALAGAGASWTYNNAGSHPRIVGGL